jgi:hypothetical protein
VESKLIVEQLVDFNKILDDSENIDVKLDDEDKDLLLLNLVLWEFPWYFLYGNEWTITLDEVQTSIRTKELQKLQEEWWLLDLGSKRWSGLQVGVEMG